MLKLFPLFKDLTISAIIAVLTANLISLPNLVYQIAIGFLILLLIFFILRGLDKRAKRLEILSVLYSEGFVRPFLNSLGNQNGAKFHGASIPKVVLYILLPRTAEELRKVRDTLRILERFTLAGEGNRPWHVSGTLTNGTLRVFDSPVVWITAIELLIETGKLKPVYVNGLLEKMNEDIRLYIRKNLELPAGKLEFVGMGEFDRYFS